MSTAATADGRPTVVVVGLGPAGPELLPAATTAALGGSHPVFFRTLRHPSAAAAVEAAGGAGRVTSFDDAYEQADRFEDVYGRIVGELVAAANAAGTVVYAVPGSPLVAERTVELLRAEPGVRLVIHPAPSFLDLAWDRLGVDPLAASVRLVDAASFASQAAGERGPLLVAQCHSRAVLSEVKLSVEEPPPGMGAVLLHHLGLPDEAVVEVDWSEVDRTSPPEPDHLTSLWVPTLAAPVGRELIALDDLVRTLRARCPWDRRQTHASLGRHLLEEAYEVLDAIDVVAATEPDVPADAAAHLEEELGDLLFQVYFHAALAAEEGRFTIADVARGLHDKLVRRHPHVFGDATADTPEEVAARWEVLKKAEKGRTSVTEGIPASLPALLLVAKLQRKAESIGAAQPSLADELARLRAAVDALATGSFPGAGDGGSGETLDADSATVGAVSDVLFGAAAVARRLGVDPETALRARAGAFRVELEALG